MELDPTGNLIIVASLIFGVGIAMIASFIDGLTRKPLKRQTATILVLGDIGRSPRMMYHAESFAEHGWETMIIGYGDTSPIPALLEYRHVHILPLYNLPALISSLPWILRAPIKIVHQIASVYFCLAQIPFRTEILLVQNPPSIPTLALARFASYLSGARLIIDWHNTGYSILSMRVGPKSVLVRIAKWFESSMGRKAYAHLFVTQALRDFLYAEWDLHTGATNGKFFKNLDYDLNPPLPQPYRPSNSKSTTFTQVSSDSTPSLASSRPALLVSSTSWTADEDFSLLLTALDIYQSSVASAKLPKLLVLITGKGHLRKGFEKAVAAREANSWKDIAVRCTFVPARDYPTLLGCADLGVSLHTSSSGLDLPMKVVDMFGCSVPVLAKGYRCLGELVTDGKNGLVFDTGEELGKQMVDVLEGFPTSKRLEQLRSFFDRSSSDPAQNKPSAQQATSPIDSDTVGEARSTWTENWDRVMHKGILRWGGDS
ncbi:MAG: mannosyltransferase [Tremellales sp. Tagirdzhanova-0007]|nr:MAG: mannosyltransferase [Tremellales sp. Tagirdzhanova-0007]